MSYTCSNPKDLKDAIMRRLGAPIINIEVTEDQIYDCIQRAMELYGEYHYDGLNKSYMAFKLTKEQAEQGLVVLDNPYNVFAVTKLLRSKTGCLTSFGGTPYTWFQDFVNGLAGGRCNTFSKFGDGMSMYVGISSYFNLLRDIMDPLPDYWFNATNGQLKIFGNFKEGDVVIAEVYVKSFVPVGSSRALVGSSGFTIGTSDCDGEIDNLNIYEDPFARMSANFKVGHDSSEFLEQTVYNVRWVKDYSTALVKEINGQVLAKHQGMQLPGGVTVDGLRLIQEAREEIETLRDELYLLEEPLPLLMG